MIFVGWVLLFGTFINAGATNCGEDEFACDVTKCKKNSWKCDGLSDCLDGTDEKNCSAGATAVGQDSLPEPRENSTEIFERKHSTKIFRRKNSTEIFKIKNMSLKEKEQPCKPELFSCNSGDCIPRLWVCDGDEDCFGGEDEADCNTVTTPAADICDKDQFLCQTDQLCIPNSLVCNRNADCTDLSDELDCGKRICNLGEVRCALTRYCIFSSWVCDNENDCVDGSDERDCKGCSEDEFACADGLCRKLSSRCDTLIDCFDGSDEKNCTKFKEPSPCSSNQFTCASDKSCVSFRKLCDRIADCSDKSDETDCGFAPCRKNEFKCRSSGSCLLDKWVCDGYEDCFDGSDEENCIGKNPPSAMDKDQESTSVSPMAGSYSSSVTPQTAPVSPPAVSEDEQEPPSVILEEAIESREECPNGFDFFRGRCLWISAFPRQWLRARELCYEMNSTLARFPLDSNFNRALLDFFQEKSITGWNYWIGKPEGIDNKDLEKMGIKIPAWFLDGRTVSPQAIGVQVYRRKCFYLNYSDFKFYEASNCLSYCGVICEAAKQ